MMKTGFLAVLLISRRRVVQLRPARAAEQGRDHSLHLGERSGPCGARLSCRH